MAILLRRDYEWLPAEAIMRNVADKRDRLLADAQLQWIALDEERADLADPVRAVDAFFEGLVEEGTLTELPPADAPVRAAAFELFGKQREAASSLFGDLGTLIALYAEQVSAAGALSTSVEAYRGYIERHILWVPSSPVVGLSTLLRAPADFGRVIASLTPTQVAGDLKAALAARPGRSFLIGVVLFALIAGRRFLRRKLEDMGQRVRSFRTDAFIYTVRAVVQSFLIALPLPLIAWSLGWALSSATHEIERAIGSALRDVGVLWLGIRFLWRLLVDKGVGAAHFKWPTESLRAIRRELRWFEPVSVILSLVVLTLDRQSVSEWSDSVGRLCFLGWMGARALLFHRVLRPGGPLTAFLEDGRGLFKRTHLIWSRVVVALPLVLGLLAALGYFYTALQFELRLRHSMGFALSLVVIHGLLLRWLFVNRRRLAVAQALEAKARREREQQEVEVTEAGAQAAAAMGFEADQVDIPDIDARTRELFRSGLTLASVLGFYLIWTSALPALQGLDRVQLLPRPRIVAAETEVPGLAAAQVGAPAPGPDGAAGASAQAEAGVAAGSGAPAPGGSASQLVAPADAEDADPITGGLPSSLTLADLLLAILLLLLTNVATRNLPALLELTVLQQLPLDSGSRYAVTTIIRYAILMVGISAVSRALGIGWAQVQWLAAALTFGLAFGLQEIFANFVSGLIILIERPVRVGDIVTVGGTEGRITQLRMRATTILDWDRREFLIPNKEFITGTVTNWTLSDPITRMVIPVGIAYGSDTNKARKLLLEVARANPLVTKDPAPSAIFRGFGDSTLDFSLRVFLPNRDLWPEAIDGLHAAIDDAFRKADIEIAFPQRDLHIRSAPNFVIERNEPSDRASDRSGSQPKTPEEPRS